MSRLCSLTSWPPVSRGCILTNRRISNAIVDMPPNPVWNQFTPISDLLNATADTTVVGLTNRNNFGTPVSDPWFRADNCTLIEGGLPPVSCEAPSPLSFLGCQEQYQFCKVKASSSDRRGRSLESCTPLAGLYTLFPVFCSLSARPGTGPRF
jgi:hypothetical protein